jgi:hypothetical protein
MNANTNANPFVRFDDLMSERGLTDRLEAYAFVDHFRWFHRSEHDCPKAGGWSNSWKRVGLYGTFARGLKFNMTTVYNWCLDHDETPFKLLNWLDAAASAMDEGMERCEAAYWRARLGEDAFDDNID